MKQLILLILIFIHFNNVFSQSPFIAVNQIGYLNNTTKNAWVCGLTNSGQKWTVKNKQSGAIVFTSTIKTPGSYDEACRQNVSMLDFSNVHEDGTYYIEVEGVGKSFPFEISNYCWNKVFKAGVKSYYYQRSGMELTTEYAGIWAKPASHTSDGYLYAGYKNAKIIKGDYRKCTGGWYDAGDFGKKIVPAAVALYPFLKLTEFYPEIVEGCHIEIPNKNKKLPDLLAEAKWELDWFFTMQENNGGVHHLIVTPEFYMGPAQNDPQIRYILTVSTAATADYAAIMAMASKVYRKYLPAYADSCLAAAEKAWGFLKITPDIYPVGGYTDPVGINGTGAYGDSNDKDERLWAAAELYATTTKTEYRQYFESNYSGFSISAASGWQSTANYAFYTWIQATAKEPANTISSSVKSRIFNWANSVESSSIKRGFGVSLDKKSYFWGSNSNVLNVGMEMLIVDRLFKTEKYSIVALNQLNYILGCNSLNLCFLSGYGTNGVKDPHQCINSYDNLDEAPPGFIPGGPNSYIDKWDMGLFNYVTKNNLPPAKCYLDQHASFSSNEVCVCYNSGLVFLSGFFYQLKPVYLK
jgi:endoglucanase